MNLKGLQRASGQGFENSRFEDMRRPRSEYVPEDKLASYSVDGGR